MPVRTGVLKMLKMSKHRLMETKGDKNATLPCTHTTGGSDKEKECAYRDTEYAPTTLTSNQWCIRNMLNNIYRTFTLNL